MMKFMKILGFAVVSEILSLFISLTLGFSGSLLMRIVCSVCTVGILLGMMAQAGISCAKSDKTMNPMFLESIGSTPYLCGWFALVLAKLGALPGGFYRVYKLLFAPFLPVCNLFSLDVAASALPWSGVVTLFVLSLLPGYAAAAGFRAEVKKLS